MQYVGQTMNSVADRFRAHFYGVTSGKTDLAVPEHFARANGHALLEDISIYVLEFLTGPPNKDQVNTRLTAERKWQFRLRTNYPAGLNRDNALVEK